MEIEACASASGLSVTARLPSFQAYTKVEGLCMFG